MASPVRFWGQQACSRAPEMGQEARDPRGDPQEGPHSSHLHPPVFHTPGGPGGLPRDVNSPSPPPSVSLTPVFHSLTASAPAGQLPPPSPAVHVT